MGREVLEWLGLALLGGHQGSRGGSYVQDRPLLRYTVWQLPTKCRRVARYRSLGLVEGAVAELWWAWASL